MKRIRDLIFKLPYITILLSVFMVIWFFTVQDRVIDSFYNVSSLFYHKEDEILFTSILIFSHVNLVHLASNVFVFIGIGAFIEDLLYTKFQYIVLLLTAILFNVWFATFVSLGIGFSLVGMTIMGVFFVSFYPNVKNRLTKVELILFSFLIVIILGLQLGMDSCLLLYGSDCSMLFMLEIVPGSTERYTSDSALAHLSGFSFGLIFGGLIELKEYMS